MCVIKIYSSHYKTLLDVPLINSHKTYLYDFFSLLYSNMDHVADWTIIDTFLEKLFFHLFLVR